ncbi:5-amino-6-(5-phosphoribosylamino)uracil reductase [Saccharopolyspora erythraea NRRL 2338]|uniref:5-amino-6-(5-phosphoribosylamino)uracil reductase n=2 Tax=Saccharopolyspora erythraea TaxID=1836 RepID=A4FAV8_SACEN|nr:pyrimidine reductase family protein [Saccharopolyspora erythraea]PFG94965.1 5-amino-6-(5-phosphoribosylamino)uracil reductase [Saccharopolyspora erythraea NRRL 2338]QRK91657.1 pyrimidine reductase family protein [Saccharopolyspora erythraea]CAM01183.1 5-amino-6-(5-phosphoribosylamino)uracil reductase [Saccharopolyspora erythraea NRRL 2338]
MSGAPQADDELEQFYAYPEALERPWVRVNFVSSLDGAVTIKGRSRGLSAPEDQRVLGLIRDLSDVVLVGVSTAVLEGYRGVKRTEVRSERRSRLGLSPVPPIALVTRSCSLPVDSPLLTDTLVPPIVLTCQAAPADRRAALADAGADVVVAGDEQVDLPAALAALDERGLRRIGCEGGPTLFGSLVESDLVDELCLTMSPLLAGGDAGRIAKGTGVGVPRRMRLLSALHTDESLLLLRYARMPA